MSNSSAGSGPSTSYPPRGLRPWVTWGKESRNVFCPHIPYRYAAEKNRGRAAGMLHSCPALPSKIGFFFLRSPPSIFFGHSPPTPGTHTCTNREDTRDLKFLLTSRKLHQASPTSSLHDLNEVKFRDVHESASLNFLK